MKKVILTILAIIALILVAGLFMPKEYNISVQTVIAAPKAQVYDYVKIIENQANYSVWYQMDPNQQITSSGTDGTVGYVSMRSGNSKAGEGMQEITNMIEDERIDVKITFVRPFASVANGSTILSGVTADETLVTSEFYGKQVWPMNILIPVCLKGIIGKDMKMNLENLKVILEKKGN